MNVICHLIAANITHHHSMCSTTYFEEFVQKTISLSPCCYAPACRPRELLTRNSIRYRLIGWRQAFDTQQYWLLSDWLKLLGWLAAQNPLSFFASHNDTSLLKHVQHEVSIRNKHEEIKCCGGKYHQCWAGQYIWPGSARPTPLHPHFFTYSPFYCPCYNQHTNLIIQWSYFQPKGTSASNPLYTCGWVLCLAYYILTVPFDTSSPGHQSHWSVHPH